MLLAAAVTSNLGRQAAATGRGRRAAGRRAAGRRAGACSRLNYSARCPKGSPGSITHHAAGLQGSGDVA